ncbi:hypothetical protein CLV78_10333 [Aliiruegeria haliotis]|uniref:Uncharacterized protein n=1 Tax=Aliiruegeria haliotis TaxID=1280846 RepID=A0A2T0RSJ4_9RHOB|nr:hypothetical protein [Aliiruegeria haliotis]PRY24169.1 hypothetical protein CLV78_10333 [Aliiruegeria haliotis]
MRTLCIALFLTISGSVSANAMFTFDLPRLTFAEDGTSGTGTTRGANTPATLPVAK